MKNTMHLMALAMLLPHFLQAANFSSAASGNWSSPATWTLTSGSDADGVPDSDDILFLPTSTHTITLDVAAAVLRVDHMQCTIDGGGSLTVTNLLRISEFGILANTGDTSAGQLIWDGKIGKPDGSTTGTVTISGITNITTGGFRYIYAKTLVLNGPTNWYESHISLNFGATLTVSPGQTFTASNIHSIFSNSGGGTFNLKGIFNHSGGNTTINVNFVNNGVLNIINGIQITLPNSYAGSGSINIGDPGHSSRSLSIGISGGLDYTNATFTNYGTVSGNSLNLDGAAQQTIAGNGTIASLNVNNSNDVIVTGTQTVSGLATLTSGKVHLQGGDFTAGSISNANGDNYFVTSGTGRLRQSVSTSAKLFPVGPSNSSYNPVTLQQAIVTPATSFGVRVSDALGNPPSNGGHVDREWDIGLISGTANTNVTLNWSSGETVGGFDASNCAVSRYNGSQWQGFGFGMASCPGLCSRTAAGVTAFSSFGVLDAAALPVELVSFGGKPQGDGSALLSWQTASELNNDGFHVEKSRDGMGFEDIGFVGGLGTSLEARQYGFADIHFTESAYYRLRQVDFDGREEFSKVIFLEKEATTGFACYPNPTAGDMKLEFDAQLSACSVQVIDKDGRIHCSLAVDGLAPTVFNLSDLPSGVYLLKIQLGNHFFTKRIIKT